MKTPQRKIVAPGNQSNNLPMFIYENKKIENKLHATSIIYDH